jgi:two-component system alkaline phosphatase synthesis response regulator PhoP
LKTLLLVEDDNHLADGLSISLKSEGYQVVHVDNGLQVIEELGRGLFDMILLDIMLPGIDGLTVCKRIRNQGYRLPILFITARDQADEIIEGLLAGGDDYITKPFDTGELMARIQGIFRRQAWLSARDVSGESYEFKGRKINFATFEAEGPRGKFTLSRKECMIVKYMVERKGEVISRDDLLDAIWGYETYPSSRTVDNFIVRLRKIFEDNPQKPSLFETIRGVGYRFSS